MAKWNEYTTKSAVEDTDELMIADATANVNKRTPLSILWNWIVSKLTSAVISQLETNSKSVVGALNELNSKAIKYYSTTSLIVQEWDEDNVGFIIKTAKHGSIQLLFTLSTGKVGIYKVKEISTE